MNAPTKVKVPEGLDLLRQAFPEHQISKLPKETRAQIDERKSNRSVMLWNCKVCGGHHHKDAVHLDYVGHAALTDRLLDADITWSWEPVAFNADGLPAFDRNGGLWIKLTVDGVTRLGYGSADGKSGGDAVKEIIGDALRNAAMRFGAALDLWHKGDLHVEDDAEPVEQPVSQQAADFSKLAMLIKATGADVGAICKAAKVSNTDELSPNQMAKVIDKLETKLAEMAKAKSDNKQPSLAEELGDEIPY